MWPGPSVICLNFGNDKKIASWLAGVKSRCLLLLDEQLWLLYDERGIVQGWPDHVESVKKHLPVDAVRVSSGLHYFDVWSS
jgi:hypothetical protein